MPEIQAFRGIRYDLGHVGSLSNVVAPPYDVISPQLRDALYKKHPANVVRLILNRPEPGDDELSNPYTRAARFLRDWQRQGVLFTEPVAALYVYHQEFEFGGQTYVRRGFMGRIRLERFGQGNIFPHEETMSGPKEDRLKLTRACRANLSQIFGLYPDDDGRAQQMLEDAIVGQTPIDAVDHLGVVHHLWPVTDPKVIAEVAAAMSGKPIFIADGHHRYETACNYRDELARQGPLPATHPANYVLMMCVSMSDPGMVVFPTHRLFRGLPMMTQEELCLALRPHFITESAGHGPETAHAVWDAMQAEGAQGTLGLYAAGDRSWTLARITSDGQRQMERLAATHGPAWRSLGVGILHVLVVDHLLGAAKLPDPGLPKPTYVHQVEEVVDELGQGDYALAALVMPPTLELIRTISLQGERMPAKSTYFYPKLLSGLVINPLE
jgi:uncharacterized protein (DUF1015 family)